MILMSINAEEDSIRVVLSHHGELGDCARTGSGHPSAV